MWRGGDDKLQDDESELRHEPFAETGAETTPEIVTPEIATTTINHSMHSDDVANTAPITPGVHDHEGALPSAGGGVVSLFNVKGEEENDEDEFYEDYYYDDDGHVVTVKRPIDKHFTHTREALEESFRATLSAPGTGRSQPNTPHEHYHRSDSLGGSMTSMTGMPEHLRVLARQIKRLNQEELLQISGIASRKAYKEVFSVLQYSGAAWYLPNIRRIHPGERRCEVNYKLHEGLIVTIAGHRMEVRVLSYFIRFALLVATWFMLWNLLPRWLMEPHGYIFDFAVIVIVSAIVGGMICRILQIPPLVGVLWIAIMWQNIPTFNTLAQGVIREERVYAARFGITLILVRAGFSLNVRAIKPIAVNAAALSCLPMAIEGIVHAFFANYLFEYNNYSWAFIHGFICSVISAAIVVPGTLVLQAEGYSKTGGPLPLMLSSVGIETTLGIWAINFMIGLIYDDTSLGLAIALGPIQIIVGAIVGVLLGIIFHYMVKLVKTEAKRLPDGSYSREFMSEVELLALVAFLIIAWNIVFFGNAYGFSGGGAVGAMLFSATISHIWGRAKEPEMPEMKRNLGKGLADVWDLVIMPVLFAMTGSAINLTQIFNADFFPKALACWVVSTITRFLVAAVTSIGIPLTLAERAFLGLAWMGKAGVQSSLANAALAEANAALSGVNATSSEYDSLVRDVERATTIKNIAIFYIIMCAPVGAVIVTKLGPIMLRKDGEPLPEDKLIKLSARNKTPAGTPMDNDTVNTVSTRTDASHATPVPSQQAEVVN